MRYNGPSNVPVYLAIIAICLAVLAMILAFATNANASEPSGDDGISKQRFDRPPVKNRHWNNETKTWLARSCVGESGQLENEI